MRQHAELMELIAQGCSLEQWATVAQVAADLLAVCFVHAPTAHLIVGPVRSNRGRVRLAPGMREPLNKSEFDRTIGRRAPLWLVEKSATRATSNLIRQTTADGLNAHVLLPLIAADEILGVLWLAGRGKGRFDDEATANGRLLAAQLSCLLERARFTSRVTLDKTCRTRLTNENLQLRELLTVPQEFSGLRGESYPWRKLLRSAELAAKSESTVLITGETGTGKGVLARALHEHSPRKNKAFIAVNCGALTKDLLSSELFGHERGAFTGAVDRRLGRIDLAQGGTLFLDEIGELPIDTQAKLLRVLHERDYERVGGTETLRCNVRVIAATNRDLEVERREGRFRDDLFYRLNVFPLRVPPLRERKEDIAPLLWLFADRFCRRAGKTFAGIDPRTRQQCLLYHWPGNVRELENLVERAVIVTPDGEPLLIDPLLEATPGPPKASDATLDDVIRSHLIAVLQRTSGKIYGRNSASEILGVKPSTLQAKLKKHGISRKEFKP